MPADQSDVAGDPERLMCPNGHQTWERTAEHYWCDEFVEDGIDIVDPDTGDTVPRTEVPAT